jgi:hypothetical protein
MNGRRWLLRQARRRARRRRGFIGAAAAATCYHPPSRRVHLPHGGQECGVCGATSGRAGYMEPTSYRGPGV